MTTVNQKLQLCIKAKDEIKEAINAKASTLATDDIRTFADAINSIGGGDSTTWVEDPIASNIVSYTDGTYRTHELPYTVEENDYDACSGCINAINNTALIHDYGTLYRVTVNGEILTDTTDTPPYILYEAKSSNIVEGSIKVNAAKTVYMYILYGYWCISAEPNTTISSIKIEVPKESAIYTWSDGTDSTYSNTYNSPMTVYADGSTKGKLINLGMSRGSIKYYSTGDFTDEYNGVTNTLSKTSLGTIGYYSWGTYTDAVLKIPAGISFAILSHPVGVSPYITDLDE